MSSHLRNLSAHKKLQYVSLLREELVLYRFKKVNMRLISSAKVDTTFNTLLLEQGAEFNGVTENILIITLPCMSYEAGPLIKVCLQVQHKLQIRRLSKTLT